MNERIIISQFANLAQTRDVKVTKPPVDQSLILDLTSGENSVFLRVPNSRRFLRSRRPFGSA